MGMFLKAFQYITKAQRHLFFLIVIWLCGSVSVWVFQTSLREELAASFPHGTEEAAGPVNQYKVAGLYDDMASIMDADLKAELRLNAALHSAAWMQYQEIAVDQFYVRSFAGLDSALVGYETGNFEENKDKKMDGSIYSYVKAVWMDEAAVRANDLGLTAEQMFRYPNDYTERMYVMLGGVMRGDYKRGDIMTVKLEHGTVEAYVLGFLPEGASAMLDGKKISLDNYIVCPLDNMDNLYGESTSTEPNYIAPVYMTGKELPEQMHMTDEQGRNLTITREDKLYQGIQAVWLDRAMLTDSSVPEYLQKALVSENGKTVYLAMMGASYEKEGLVKVGNNFFITTERGDFNMVCVGILPEGVSEQVDGKTVILDDYIVLMQPDYAALVQPDQTAAQEDKEDAGEASEEEDADSENVVAVMNPVTYTAAERAKLFQILFMKNRGYAKSAYTADEVQKKLSVITEEAWKKFHMENEGKTAITTYYIREADSADSILFRADAEKLADVLRKVAIGCLAFGMGLLCLYQLAKLRGERAYCTVLVMNGTAPLMLALVVLLEAVGLFLFSSGAAYLVSFVICKLLEIKMTGMKQVIGWNLLVIVIPCILTMAYLMLKDYGKVFRRR